jgi:UDP-N-acetylglucosamine 2-epimerase
MLDNKTEKQENSRLARTEKRKKILILFGTRPEAIKLAPVIYELKNRGFRTLVVCSNQHRELLDSFFKLFDVKTDYDLDVMRENQTPNEICSRVLAKMDELLTAEKPDLILVQGDTTTTLAGALAGFNCRVPVGHVEAGLRSGNIYSPFPEEMNRRLVSQIASLHFAATELNRSNLLNENIPSEKIFVTGNTVVDTLRYILKNFKPSEKINEIIKQSEGKKRILLTTHRRESFGEKMLGNLEVLRDFVEKKKDVCLIFPVHPNPNVRSATDKILAGRDRIFLLEPLDYCDFIALMKKSWLIVSDSGGVQEESPSLGKPLLILRENTERPEAIRSGVAKLVGGSPRILKMMLEENYAVETWIRSVNEVSNPFGDGLAAKRIVNIIEQQLGLRHLRANSAQKALL